MVATASQPLSLVEASREPAADPALVSVMVRSYNRLPALCTLLETLLRQRYPRFEIVIVEQSTMRPAEAEARLEELARDPRVRLLRHPPLGGAGARNVGVAACRGEIIVFIDDDDLPTDDLWLARHAAAYEDPRCLGVSGKHIHNDEPVHRYQPLLAAITRTLSYDPILKTSLTYVQHDRRRIPVYAIHGTNASIRRRTYERFGGWDTDTAIEDEVSFCLRVLKRKHPDEYFAYDPRPTILRNRDVPGGLDKRRMSAVRYFGHFLDFVHNILGRYHPVRVVALYPIYLLVSYVLSVGWLWKNSRVYASPPRLVWASMVLAAGMPLHVGRALGRVLARRRGG
jgi:glycosyltransferase involved in cell wall biosynthesis